MLSTCRCYFRHDDPRDRNHAINTPRVRITMIHSNVESGIQCTYHRNLTVFRNAHLLCPWYVVLDVGLQLHAPFNFTLL